MMRSESRPSNWLSPMCLATVSRIVASLVAAAAFSVAGVGVAARITDTGTNGPPFHDFYDNPAPGVVSITLT